MNYRLQDFIKYIIPGLYVIFFCLYMERFVFKIPNRYCKIERFY